MVSLDILNNEQKEAVLDFDHNLLLLACAGSGKTRTITTKICYALENRLYRPSQVLAVTFTNRAAFEMKERISSLIDDVDLTHLTVKTFHAFGAYLLRLFYKSVGLRENFCVYDDDDSVSLLYHSLPNKMEKSYIKEVYKDIAKAKDNGYTIEDPNLSEVSTFPDFSELFGIYENALKQTGNVDFADLISLTRKELEKKDSEMARYCHSRYKFILVDEYQDSNKEQFALLKALISDDTKLVVVGDDDQSIYSFRGANVENILTFSTSFENVREIKIEKNYRSTDEILSAAASLIKNNKERHVKDIVSAMNKRGIKPEVIKTYSGFEEASEIVSRIALNGSYDDTAILYRLNAQSALFEKELINQRIPYKIVGTLKFYEREEVKDAIAFLYFLLNPYDFVSFNRIINKPARGIGPKKINEIRLLSNNLSEALALYINSTNNKGAKEFYEALIKAEKNIDSNEIKLGTVLEEALKDLNIIEYYKNVPDKVLRDSKLDNINALISILNEKGIGRENLTDFLEELTLDSTKLGNRDSRDDEGVTLITMHNTKGLEYDYVYCVGLEEDIIPGRNRDEAALLEEERRILYVAMTRARKELYLSYAAFRSRFGSSSQPTIVSSFLKEIPHELLKGNLVDLKPKQKETIKNTSSFIGWKKDASLFNLEKANKIQANVTYEEKEKKSIKRATKLDIGDKVKNENYGVGYIEDKILRSDAPSILVARFGEKKVKFIEGKAPLEKL